MTLDDFYKQTSESDASLAAKHGMLQTTIWRIRTGRAVPRYETAEKISQAIGGAISAADIQKQAAEMFRARRDQAAA